MAFAYFGPSVSYTTRHHVMSQLMGSDKESIAKKNTLVDKQPKLLSVQRAVTFCYGNYQRGLKLFHQRGKHSSAYFKGTHQCRWTFLEILHLIGCMLSLRKWINQFTLLGVCLSSNSLISQIHRNLLSITNTMSLPQHQSLPELGWKIMSSWHDSAASYIASIEHFRHAMIKRILWLTSVHPSSLARH